MKNFHSWLPLFALLPLVACNEDGTVDSQTVGDAASKVSREAEEWADQAGEALDDLQGQLEDMLGGLSETAKDALGDIDLSEMDVDKLKGLLNEKTAELAELKEQIESVDLPNLTSNLSLEELKEQVPSLQETIDFLRDAIKALGG